MKTFIIFILLIMFTRAAQASEGVPSSNELFEAIELGDWSRTRTLVDETLAKTPDSSVALLASANLNSITGKADTAIEECKKVLAKEPQNVEALFIRGTILSTVRKNKEGAADLNQFLNLTRLSRDPRIKLLRADAFETFKDYGKEEEESKSAELLTRAASSTREILARGKAQIKLKEYKEAIRTLSKLKRAEEFTPKLSLLLATCELENENTDKALIEFAKIAEHAPDYFANEGSWGWALEQQKKYDEAIKHYDRALEIEANYVFALIRRSWCHFEKHDYKSALQDANKAIAADPDDFQAYWPRAAVNRELKRYKEEEADHKRREALAYRPIELEFERQIAIDPKNAKAWIELGCAQAHRGKLREGLASVNHAIMLSPDNADALCHRGGIEVELGDHASAHNDLAAALRINPNWQYAHYTRGMLFRAEKKYANAIAELSNAIKIDPKNAMYYCARGCAEVRASKYWQAIIDCNMALKLDSYRRHAQLTRAEAYAAVGKLDSALRDFNKVLKHNPRNIEALTERARLYKRLNKPTLAAADLSTLRELNTPSEGKKFE